MKIEHTVYRPSLQRTSAPALPVASGFRLPGLAEASGARAAIPLRAASAAGLVAAIAAEEDGQHARRRKRMAHAASLLDALEGLARELAAGVIESGTLEGLSARLGGAGDSSTDPALDALVAEIELRAAVEMAKLKARKGRF